MHELVEPTVSAPHPPRRARFSALTAPALGVLAAVLLASQPSSAEGTGGATQVQTADGSARLSELRSRYAGFYRYAGDAREQEAREEAIDRSVSSFFFAVRGMARSKIQDRTRILPTCKFDFVEGKIRSQVPGHPLAVSPETGAPAPYRVEDDAIVLRQRFVGEHLVQTFTASEGGTRKNEFTLSPDGNYLYMKATLSSPKLSIPVVYTLTYRRVPGR